MPLFSGWPAGRGASPQVTLHVLLCVRQSRLSFLPPFIAFSGTVNPPFHNSAAAIAKLPGAASFAMMGRDFQSFASKRATVPMSGRWGNQ